jgi:hypothetical protein
LDYITSEEKRLDEIEDKLKEISHEQLVNTVSTDIIRAGPSSSSIPSPKEDIEDIKQYQTKAAKTITSNTQGLQKVGLNIQENINFPYTFVIAGSFSREDNALAFKNDLNKSTPYDFAVYELKPKLYVVQINENLTSQQAEDRVTYLKSQTSAHDAFIFKSRTPRQADQLRE